MTETTADAPARDYSETLFLPRTDFPMRAELPKREPEFLERWERLSLYRRLRESAAKSPRFVLHDGPPYANGHLHIGHALNKVLKDIVVRSKQMTGHDANYVPGWDCHGLPIEWRVEEEYRASGRNKDEVPVNDFRRECRAYAENWINVQREEFKRLGVTGDWEHPYTTMAFRAEAVIAGELMKFAEASQLYRGSKPVMWSIVEKTALAEAEVEYQEHTSHTIFVKFPVRKGPADLTDASVVIWTTTPWTIPGNRAVAFAPHIAYGLYEVKSAPEDNWTTPGAKLILADALADTAFKAGRIDLAERLRTVTEDELSGLVLAHPLHAQGYDFGVPVLHGDFVTEDTGTGFVHIAPGHGADDYNLWIRNRAHLVSLGIDAEVPHTVAPDGSYFPHVPLFAGLFVLDDKGKEGAANKAVIDALVAAGGLLARGRLRHQYPHSWRSKAPLIYRNTPQWFIPMDRSYATGNNDTLRERALTAISQTAFYPPQGENRLRGMIESRPDWVVSRQRAWGVPISIFIREDGAGGVAAMAPGPDFAHNEELSLRIRTAFEAEGADAWFADGATERFLGGLVDDLSGWRKIDDILDVWFDSGSTHAFVLEERADLGWPAAMYLEGSDQHRGWFHSSLLESCGTRGRAPYDSLLTHGFVLDEQGRKMSKSLGNTVSPQDVINKSGADILRLWVAQSDYADDLRIGPEILKTVVDTYRKLRNTLRWMLGALGHFREEDRVAYADMPELEQLMLHRLWEVGQAVENGYEAYDFKKVFAALMPFLTSDLSAFYFDIRKDALYCDPISSVTRRACLTVIDTLFDRVVRWLAPLIPFTTEESWLLRHPSDDGSIHLQGFATAPDEWRNDALEERWETIRRVRRVVTGALELERAGKRIGSSLEAAPEIYVADAAMRAALEGVDLAEVCITSGASLIAGDGPTEAFRLDEVAGVAVVPLRAEGRKCARSWKISPEVGADPEFPDITPRDAQAMREWLAERA